MVIYRPKRLIFLLTLAACTASTIVHGLQTPFTHTVRRSFSPQHMADSLSIDVSRNSIKWGVESHTSPSTRNAKDMMPSTATVFRYIIPTVGLLCGGLLSTNPATAQLPLIQGVGSGFSLKSLLGILFLGGVGNKVADALDDDNLWVPASDSSVLHCKVSPNLLSLALHANTAAAFFASMTCPNPVPAALLTAMYSYAWVVRGKACPKSSKPMEALVIMLAGIPFWSVIGAKMTQSLPFAVTWLTSLASTTWWLRRGRHHTAAPAGPSNKVANFITETGIFRTLPTLLLSPFLLGATSVFGAAQALGLGLGAAVFHADNLGHTLSKSMIKKFGKAFAKYGMVGCGLFWQIAYFLYSIEGYPIENLTWLYCLVWEGFFTVDRSFMGKSFQWSRFFAPFVWLATDSLLAVRCHPKPFVLLSSAAALAGGMLHLRKTKRLNQDHVDLFKLTSWATAFFMTIDAHRFVLQDPTRLLRKLALLSISVSHILGSFRSLSQLNGDDKRFSWLSPVVVTVALQALGELWFLLFLCK